MNPILLTSDFFFKDTCRKAFFCFFKGGFFIYCIQHCFICRPSDFTVSEDVGIEPRTVATMAVRRSNHSAKSHPRSWSWSGLVWKSHLFCHVYLCVCVWASLKWKLAAGWLVVTTSSRLMNWRRDGQQSVALSAWKPLHYQHTRARRPNFRPHSINGGKKIPAAV